MAIQWGAWKYSGGNGMRVGIEIEWKAANGTEVSHLTTTARAHVDYYTQNQYTYGDDQTLNLSGAISGSISFYNGQGGAITHRGKRTYDYDYGANEYGSSPGTRTFTSKLSGAFNGITPSVSVSSKIPARPYDSPAAPTNVSVSRVSDTQQKITWTNKSTAGEPWDSINIDRDPFVNNTWYNAGDPGGGATSFTDNGTVENRDWRYRIRAENSVGNSSWVTTAVFYTSPATPTNVSRSGSAGQNQVISWTNNVNYSDDAYETLLYVSVDGGTWSHLATLGSGVTSYTHTTPASNPDKSYKYRARTRTTQGTQGTLYSAYSNETTGSPKGTSAPNPATNLSPSKSTIVPTQINRFSWKFNSTDGTPQRAYRIRYRMAGTSTWTTLDSVYTSNSYWDSPANTFLNDSTYEWQVATWGTSSSGTWSGTATFYTSSDPSQVRQNMRPVVLNTDTGDLETAPRGVLPPVGSVIPFAGDVTPTGWLLCNGQQVAQSSNEDLFTVIGTKFNTGGESAGYFRVPNVRDRFIVGASSSKAAGTTGGSSTKTLSTPNIPTHNHSMTHNHNTDSQGAHSHVANLSNNSSAGTHLNRAASGNTSALVSSGSAFISSDGAHTHSVSDFSGATGERGSGTSFDVMNPWIAMNYIIKK